MALVLADRVLETTSVAGTGDASLNGAVTGYQPFSVIGGGNTTYYTIVAIDDNGSPTGDWEVGIGTYVTSGNKVSRDTVLSSSNGGALVYFASGNKQIFLDLPSEELVTTASTGLSISGNTITNTAPDQIVSLTGAGTTTITGTYPSFTITSTGGSGGGDVTGPASSTDNALVRFDGTTGKVIQNSSATLTDAGILSTDKELVGSNANFTDFPNAQAVFSQANTGSNHIYNMGIAGEGVATDVVGAGQWGVGVYGTGATAGATRGIGVVGDGHVGNTADTAAAIGVRGYSTNTHSGGQNIGLYSQATGGASNYSLFMASGNIYSAVTQTWAVPDNETSALSIDTTGKAGILKIVTTNAAEKVTMSGGLDVTGTTTLATSLSGLAKLTSGVVSAATSGTDYAPATSGTSILYGNGSGGFSNVTIGTGVSFAGGTLSATGLGGTVTSVAATAGTGISVTGSPITSSGTLTITNTAPDQTVAITGAGGAVVTGTYPNFTITTPSGTVTSVSGTAPIASSGGVTPAISISQATTSTDGYLSSTDWNTFNNKQPSGSYLTAVTASAPLSGSGTVGSPLVISQATTSTNGYLSSTDWNTFNNKGSGTVTSVTGTAPVVSSGGATPAISMAAATTSVNGYLTSTDWNTFNGKYSTGGALGTPSSGTLTNCTGYTYANLSGTVPTWNQDTTGKSAKTDALNSATTTINVSSATAPSAGQALIATSSTAATWQTIAASQWTTSGSNIYYNTGNVGINISSPTVKLQVRGGTSAGLNESFRVTGGGAFGDSGPSIGFHDYYDGNYPTWKLGEIGALYAGGVSYEGALVFHTNTGTTATSLTEKMRLTNTGQLTVGSTSPVSAGWLTLNYDGQNYNGLMTRTTTSGTYYGAMFKNVSDSFVGNISVSASATAYNTSSDYRLKDNVASMQGALEKVLLLKPVTYKWKIDGSDGEGFIAHELAEVCPLAVTGEKDALNEDGSIKSQSIDTSFLVATLTAAIQELDAKVKVLESKLAAK